MAVNYPPTLSVENFQNLGSLRSHLLAILAFYAANVGLAVAGSAGPVPLPLYNMCGYVH